MFLVSRVKPKKICFFSWSMSRSCVNVACLDTYRATFSCIRACFSISYTLQGFMTQETVFDGRVLNMGEKMNVNWAVDTDVVAILKASVDRYNKAHEHKTYPGEVVAVSMRLFRTYRWIFQQQMIDHRDDLEWWEAVHKAGRQPPEWPDDYGPTPETPGSTSRGR